MVNVIEIIEYFKNIISVEELTVGWSVDQKLLVNTSEGKFLVRIRKSTLESMKRKINIISSINSLELPIPDLLFSKYIDGFQVLVFEWLEGTPAKDAISTLSREEQYRLGYESGLYLKKIHGLKAPEGTVPWQERYSQKIDKVLGDYDNQLFSFEGDDIIAQYIVNNRKLISDLDNYVQHGDFHIGNMLIDNGELKVIDLDRCDYGERVEEYNRVYFTSLTSRDFAKGQVEAYLDKSDIPNFFKLMLLYQCVNLFSSFIWAQGFGEEEIKTTYKLCEYIFDEYDNLNTIYPRWYRQNTSM